MLSLMRLLMYLVLLRLLLSIYLSICRIGRSITMMVKNAFLRALDHHALRCFIAVIQNKVMFQLLRGLYHQVF
jgi:hypothetical protein